MSEVLASIVEDNVLIEFRFAGCECRDSVLFVYWSRIDFAGAKLLALAVPTVHTTIVAMAT